MRQQAELACLGFSFETVLACPPGEALSQLLIPLGPQLTHLYNQVIGTRYAFSVCW